MIALNSLFLNSVKGKLPKIKMNEQNLPNMVANHTDMVGVVNFKFLPKTIAKLKNPRVNSTRFHPVLKTGILR
ncbi:MAG: hypothetical protein ACJAUQ_000267 [Maribacter sp.]|jgi:hypothetical protein